MNIKDEPQTLDPRRVKDLSGITVTKMLFEGLVRLNQEGKIERALADRIDISSDQLTYTFFLREAFWTNGEPVTAFDFEYAWKMCLHPDFPSDTAFQMYGISRAKAVKEGVVPLEEVGIRAIDSQTLRVNLERPIPYFLSLLASPPFFPVHERLDRQNSQWACDAAHFVGNGPFTLRAWKHQNHLVVEKNETYWDAQSVKLEGIELAMVHEETELMLFEKKELDWIGSPLSTIPLEAIGGLKKNSALKAKEMLGTYFLRTNTKKPPFDNVKIRKAFALAVNRRAIVEHVLNGDQLVATGLVPAIFGLQTSPYFQDGDLAQAHRLFQEGLCEMGISREDLPQITFLYRARERNHLIAQAIQQQWFEALGIRVQLESLEGKVYFDRVSKSDYHLAASDWIADFEDPINFLDVFKYQFGGSNHTYWESQKYVHLLDQASEACDPLKRLDFLSRAEKTLMEEMPIMPIFHYQMLYANHPQICNVVLSHLGQLDFKWAYFDKRDQEVAR
jgi:oligopeptide transport system substrate-binding protein